MPTTIFNCMCNCYIYMHVHTFEVDEAVKVKHVVKDNCDCGLRGEKHIHVTST